MNNRFIRLLLVSGFCIPYAFLCLYGDLAHDTLLLYPVSVLCLLFLEYASDRTGHPRLSYAGHLLSCFSSLIALQFMTDERWLWYFKPLSAMQMILLVCTVLSLLSGMILRIFRRLS